MNTTPQIAIQLRKPCIADIPGILAAIRSGAPFVTAHDPYIYWMQIRLYGDVSAVAVLNGEVVGWCCVVRGLSGRYFVHQLGVAHIARRQGVAHALLTYVVARIKAERGMPEIEFTIDRRNGPALALVEAVATDAGMLMRRSIEPVQLLDKDSGEDLYALTSLAERHTDISDEVPNALWTTTGRTEATVTNGSNS